MPNTPGVADHAASPEADARNRAFRTFLQGLALDVLLAVALIVYGATSSDHVEWRLLLLTVAKTAVQTAASYVMRKLSPPATT
jgi:hypothetical protein